MFVFVFNQALKWYNFIFGAWMNTSCLLKGYLETEKCYVSVFILLDISLYIECYRINFMRFFIHTDMSSSIQFFLNILLKLLLVKIEQ